MVEQPASSLRILDAVPVLVTAVNTHALSLTRQYADTATLDFCNHKNNLCSMAAWAFAAPTSELHQTADAAQSGRRPCCEYRTTTSQAALCT